MVVEELVKSFTTIGLSNPLIVSTVIAVVRATAGWLENSLSNGKIDHLEWKKYIETMFRVIPQALGLSAFGIPAIGAFFTDWIGYSILKKKK